MYEEACGKFSKHLDFIMLDFVMLQAVLIIAYGLRHMGAWLYNDNVYKYYAVVLTLLHFLIAFFAQSYKNVLKRGYIKELRATIVHVSYVILLSVLFLFLGKVGREFSRIILVSVWAGGIGCVYLARCVLKCWLRKCMLASRETRCIALFTTKGEVEKIISQIKANPYRNYIISQIVLFDDPLDDQILGEIPVSLYEENHTINLLKTSIVDEVFISIPRDMELPSGVLEGCYQLGVTVHINLVPRAYEMGTKVVEEFAGYMVLTTGLKIAKPYQVFIKRSVDILGGIVGTLLTGILILILGPMIYIKDPGPIFFSQVRMGKNGRRFKIYKFRSMYMNAEERREELMSQNEMQGPMFKMEHDPRIIPGVGEKIRAWSLDEFPQFVNVLKGDMSLVGTRPPTVDEWEQYENHHCRRLAIKPGVTGMWQVSGRSDITNFEDVVELDTKYITEWTLGLDLKILFKTVLVVLGKCGSR